MTKFTFFLVFLAFLFFICPSASAQEKLIRVNLATKRLVLIEDGQWTAQYKVAGIGDPARKPTPQGKFTILGKEKMHKSSITDLVMPWSVRFYDDYYIHEIPENKAGKKTKTEYSLGCIRLKPKDAKKVYEWTDIGTKLTIYKAQLVAIPESEKYFWLYKTGVRRQIFDSAAKDKVKIILEAELKSYLRLPVSKNTRKQTPAPPSTIFSKFYRTIKNIFALLKSLII